MHEIHLPKGTKIWPVIARPDTPAKRFPAKFDALTQDITLDPAVIFKVPASKRFAFFQDGVVVLPHYVKMANGTNTFSNPAGMYAYCEFTSSKTDGAGNIVYGFIFNMHRALKTKGAECWKLEPYFVDRSTPDLSNKPIDIDDESEDDLPF